jgi:hypothetical protein
LLEQRISRTAVDTSLPLQKPSPGAVVLVRSRRYLVESVEAAQDTTWEQTLVELSCLDDDAQGERLSVLWEREVDASILEASLWDSVASRGASKWHGTNTPLIPGELAITVFVVCHSSRGHRERQAGTVGIVEWSRRTR